jgi:SAM-dependent methyltransferase
MVAPDPRAWLVLDESERLAKVLRYHKRKQASAGSLKAHAAIHTAVETRLAEGHASATATLRRLLEEGLDRHDAVHAIGSVLPKQLSDGVKGKPFRRDAYVPGLDALNAAAWRRLGQNGRSRARKVGARKRDVSGSERGADARRAPRQVVGHYDANYGHFASSLYQEIRREAYGQDLGQNSWLTAAELLKFAHWLELMPGRRLLDVSCGSGGPALHMAKATGCQVLGIDNHEQAVANAKALTHGEGLTEQASFDRLDASQPLPFSAASFDAVTCIDAVNHFPDRRMVFSEWTRVLKPGGRLVVTDPIVVTGPLTHAEIAARSSIGFYLFVPPGEDERLLRVVGLELLMVEDLTEMVAQVARGRRKAREGRASALRQIEGDTTFEGQQEFLRVAESIAAERRLSRFAFLARKPS